MSRSITPDLREFALWTGDLPGSALEMMRLSLLDWAVCGLAGKNEPVARILRGQAGADGGVGQSSVIGSKVPIPAKSAAMVNGATAHALDYDDTHFAHIGHPSVAIIPAALAVSQMTQATGAAFLEAALIGVETSVRVGVWLGRGHYQAGFHQTATAGAFGATIAATRLLGLKGDQIGHALGLVSTRASGLKSQFGTMGKPMNAGIAAFNGVEAAQLALAGMQSNPDAVAHFAHTHAGEGNRQHFDTPPQNCLIESINYKFFACCHGLHAMIEAILTTGDTLDLDRITQVVITTNPRWRRVCNIECPQTGLEAKFSYRLCAAMALSGVELAAPDSYCDANTQNARMNALRDRVKVIFDPAISETAAQVQVHDGRGALPVVSHDLADPMPVALRQCKLMSKAQTLIGPQRAADLWNAIDGVPDMDELARLLTA